MDSAPHELQILTAVLVGLAVCIALICDFLKRENRRLRELVIELKARAEEGPHSAERSIDTPRPLEGREAAPAFAQRERPADRPRRQPRPRSPGATALSAQAAAPKPDPRTVPKAAQKKDWESLLTRASLRGHAPDM
jgi:uncharacterized membrane protein